MNIGNGPALAFRDARTGWSTKPLAIGLRTTTNGGRTWKLSQGRILGAPSTGVGALPARVAQLANLVEIDLVGGALFLLYDGQVPEFGTTRPGARSGVLVSRDFGRTWRRCLSLPAVNENVSSLSGVDARHLWVEVAKGNLDQPHELDLLRTADGGRHWRKLSGGAFGGSSEIMSLPDGPEFVNAEQGWASDPNQGGVLRSDDGGVTWRQAGMTGTSSTDLLALDPIHAWYCNGYRLDDGTHGGGLWSTSDGGRSWQTVKVFGGTPLYSIFFLDLRRGWVTGEDAVYGTTDGGAHWIKELILPPNVPDVSEWVFAKAGDTLIAGDGSALFVRRL